MNSGIEELNPDYARRIIETLGSHGTPPEYGFQFFTEGIEDYLQAIDEEYISSFIPEGGSAFKMVVGVYGGGKTHFLYSIREKAWRHNHVVSYIQLSPQSSPFHKLEAVYKEVIKNLLPPMTPEELTEGYNKGVKTILEKWYNQKKARLSSLNEEEFNSEITRYLNNLGQYESTSFRKAVKSAFLAIKDDNQEDYDKILQWLEGESIPKSEVKRFGIYDKIDKSTAFKMIGSLVQWIADIGYDGVVILLDEAEQMTSLSSKQKGTHLQNLREIIDECGHSAFGKTMWFYAVPDESFLEGRTQIYEALRQRLDTVFNDKKNPHGIKIRLDDEQGDTIQTMINIGRKLSRIYERAYGFEFEKESLDETLKNVADFAYGKKLETGFKRLFVQKSIHGFNILKRTGKPVSVGDLDT